MHAQYIQVQLVLTLQNQAKTTIQWPYHTYIQIQPTSLRFLHLYFQAIRAHSFPA